MRKVYLFNMITLDGYFEGKNPWDIDWHSTDSEFNDFAIEQLKSAGMLLFGRKTYEGMAAYWGSEPVVAKGTPVAKLMNELPKGVVSKTLKSADWVNTTLFSGDVREEIARLKQQPGKEIGIFGSANLAASIPDLIDEYRIIINPVILGGGSPMFPPSAEQRNLKLVRSRTFGNGNILLYYTPLNK